MDGCGCVNGVCILTKDKLKVCQCDEGFKGTFQQLFN